LRSFFSFILFTVIAAIFAQPTSINKDIQAVGRSIRTCAFEEGGIIRGPISEKKIALIFTGGDYADGGNVIQSVLAKTNLRANFFFTGDFYRNPSNESLILKLVADGHYLGPHSDKHLLYCSWENRDRLLVNKREFVSDIRNNYREIEKFGISGKDSRYFVPPYEWYNEKIVAWADEIGLTLINFTPGTGSNADYTTPSMPNYRSSEWIYNSIVGYEKSETNGFNGFLLLLHIGSHPDREDKFYNRLEGLIDFFKSSGYGFLRVDEMLADCGS
jgi:peptidoglycan/xylan/chitin deacetylase (PgdA/CDA1 family)